MNMHHTKGRNVAHHWLIGSPASTTIGLPPTPPAWE